MSADNGVYILKTKDQYRVIETQAIENIYFSFIEPEKLGNHIIPTRVLEYWGNCRYTFNQETAMRVADRILKSVIEDYGVCEYGIRIFEYDKPWKKIVQDAKCLAKLELEKIASFEGCYYDNVRKQLNDIIEETIA